jgi:hypothetical protein
MPGQREVHVRSTRGRSQVHALWHRAPRKLFDSSRLAAGPPRGHGCYGRVRSWSVRDDGKHRCGPAWHLRQVLQPTTTIAVLVIPEMSLPCVKKGPKTRFISMTAARADDTPDTQLTSGRAHRAVWPFLRR